MGSHCRALRATGWTGELQRRSIHLLHRVRARMVSLHSNNDLIFTGVYFRFLHVATSEVLHPIYSTCEYPIYVRHLRLVACSIFRWVYPMCALILALKLEKGALICIAAVAIYLAFLRHFLLHGGVSRRCEWLSWRRFAFIVAFSGVIESADFNS